MILLLASVLVVFWVLGLLLNIGGALIHLLLVIAIIMFIAHLFTRKGK